MTCTGSYVNIYLFTSHPLFLNLDNGFSNLDNLFWKCDIVLKTAFISPVACHAYTSPSMMVKCRRRWVNIGAAEGLRLM